MRITIITGAFLPIPPVACGAVEIRWHGVAQEFAQRGHRVTFLSRAWPGQKADETVDGVHHIRRGGFKRTRMLWLDLVKSFVYGLQLLFRVPPSDICITNTVWLPILLARFRPKTGKIVVNVARFPKGQMGLYLRAARLACPSTTVADEVVRQTSAATSITKVVPNCVNTKIFAPPDAPRQWDGKRYVVYTGRIHPEKGVHVLIDAFAQLKDRPADLVLRLVGPTESARGGGGKAYLRELQSKARRLPVEFVPTITDRYELARMLQQGHYYCYPSLAERGESFGVAPMEAMATGLAPIVSGLACFRDFVRDGINGMIFDHRCNPVQNLANALTGQIADTPRMIQMGQTAAQTAMRFSNARVADLYLEDFESLLAAQCSTNEGTVA